MTLQWRQRRIVVLGAGRSGLAVTRFLCARGARVVLVDRDPPRQWQGQPPSGDVTLCNEEHGVEQVGTAELVVTSPGIPPTNVVLQQAQKCGVPVWSEIELAARELNVPIVAITGTNGKSTTTTLIGDIVRQAGRRVFVGGNLGTPLIEAAGHTEYSLAVAEVSSFQLEWVDRFRPVVGVFLNLTPDHLDRYPSLDSYGETKLRLFARQTSEDFAILNRTDPWIWSRRDHIRATIRWFGDDPAASPDAWVEGNVLHVHTPPSEPWRLDLSTTPLVGAHNRQNIMAAVLAARCLNLPLAAVVAALQQARPLPHRLEFVREWRGVHFYDDSKGTNVGAVQKSLETFDRPVILLAGGYDKGSDFRCLADELANRVRHAIFFGATAEKWAAQTGRFVSHSVVAGLRDAVRLAAEIARPGEVVLLSPGCSSFDEFEDYAHRGRCFRQWVEEL